jgi:hypothetical protein
MLGGFHKHKKSRKVHDARHIGVGKLDAALGVKFVGHLGWF